ncbi:hypothetical protein ACA910_020881 [Epithemia clementina (nom. ined.)]
MAALPPEQQDFLQVLQNVVGMNPAQANLLRQNGIMDVNDLANIDEESALDIHRGNGRLNVMMKSKFKAFMAWSFNQIRMNPPLPLPDANFFDANICTEYLQQACKHACDKGLKRSKEDTKPLEPWNGQIKLWPKKKHNHYAYLGQCKSHLENIPLIYIFYLLADPDFYIDARVL